MRFRYVCRRGLVLVMLMYMICVITRELQFGAHHTIDTRTTNHVG
jgi:hypothetical protein